MSRIRKWTPVVVEWTDAVTVYEPSHSDDPHEPAARKTIGFLLAKNKQGVTVAMEDDREKGDEADCQTVTTIPAKMVRKISQLSIREELSNGRDRQTNCSTGQPDPEA